LTLHLLNNLKSISREEDANKGELFDYDDADQLKSVPCKADGSSAIMNMTRREMRGQFSA
jgi:hypothetical protein